MSLEKPTLVDLVLNELYNLAEMLPKPFEAPYAHSKRLRHFDPNKYRRTVRDLSGRGLVKITTKNEKRFLELTKQGVLRVLFLKAQLQKPDSWDGKWRLVMFDIPESSNRERKLFRSLLLNNGFKKLQASVYVNPYPLNRSAVEFLKASGLIDFVRIMRIDELDNESELKKKFKLS